MPGRKPFTPTEEQRRTVRSMAGYGVPHDEIALVVRCSPPTLRKWCRHELDVAGVEANAPVAQTLYQQATTPGNIAASIFSLKARAGWREKQAVGVTGARSGPLASPDRVVLHVVSGVPRAGLFETAKPCPTKMRGGPR